MSFCPSEGPGSASEVVGTAFIEHPEPAPPVGSALLPTCIGSSYSAILDCPTLLVQIWTLVSHSTWPPPPFLEFNFCQHFKCQHLKSTKLLQHLKSTEPPATLLCQLCRHLVRQSRYECGRCLQLAPGHPAAGALLWLHHPLLDGALHLHPAGIWFFNPAMHVGAASNQHLGAPRPALPPGYGSAPSPTCVFPGPVHPPRRHLVLQSRNGCGRCPAFQAEINTCRPSWAPRGPRSLLAPLPHPLAFSPPTL